MSNDLAQPARAPEDKARRTWVLALTSLASFMAAIDATVVTTALSTIRANLHAPLETLQWTVNAYNLSFAVLLLTGAALGDRFGRRRMLVCGLALFVAASAACATANDIAWLIAARAVQGAGAALVMPLSMALLSAAFPKETRAKALGVFGSIVGLALIVGPAAGGAITEGLAWQWIFWINIPMGIVLIPLIVGRVPESRVSGASLDLAGLALAAIAALGVVWGLLRGHDAGWLSAEVVAALALGVLMTAGFVAWERRARAPMLPMRMFGSRTFSWGVAASFLLFAPMYGILFFLPQFLQAQGNGPFAAGVRLIPWTATLFVVAPIAGNLASRVGERPLVATGLLLQAVGAAWIALLASPDVAYARLVLPLIVAGGGVSMAMPALQNAVLSAVAPSEIGKASGTYNMFRYLGGVFGIALLVEVFARTGDMASALSFSVGFSRVMGIVSALSLLGAIAGLQLPGRRRSVPAAGPGVGLNDVSTKGLSS